MPGQDPDWLGELRWRGYPKLEPRRDVSALPAEQKPAPPAPAPDPRAAEVARENEALRARLDDLMRLAADFERRLGEAGTRYEAAILEAESRLRDAALERERLAGELSAAKAEAARLSARDAAREADLKLERERRTDADKSLVEALRRVAELTKEAEALRASAAEAEGVIGELRRQAAARNESLERAKALTDADVHLLRSEMREFLAKLHRLNDDRSGDNR